MPRIEIFKTGRHTDMHGQKISFRESDLKEIVDGYDPKVHEAPIVVGHPKDNGPAFGWVGSLEYADGAIVADLSQIDPDFAESVRAGHYKKVSAAFYGPKSPSNPNPGSFSLRHIGFLGAMPPAIKGLKALDIAAFSEDDEEVITLDFFETDLSFGELEPRTVANLFGRMREFIIEQFGTEKADKVIPTYDVDCLKEQAATPEPAKDSSFSEDAKGTPKPIQETDDMPKPGEKPLTDAEFAEREAVLDAREKKIKEQDMAFAEKHAKTDATDFIAPLVKSGHILPAQEAGLVNFMAKLDGADTLCFAEGEDEISQRGFLQAFLKMMPKQVEYGEMSEDDGAAPVDGNDPSAIADQALEYQEEMAGKGRTISIDTCVRHVTKTL